MLHHEEPARRRETLPRHQEHRLRQTAKSRSRRPGDRRHHRPGRRLHDRGRPAQRRRLGTEAGRRRRAGREGRARQPATHLAAGQGSLRRSTRRGGGRPLLRTQRRTHGEQLHHPPLPHQAAHLQPLCRQQAPLRTLDVQPLRRLARADVERQPLHALQGGTEHAAQPRLLPCRRLLRSAAPARHPQATGTLQHPPRPPLPHGQHRLPDVPPGGRQHHPGHRGSLAPAPGRPLQRRDPRGRTQTHSRRTARARLLLPAARLHHLPRRHPADTPHGKDTGAPLADCPHGGHETISYR